MSVFYDPEFSKKFKVIEPYLEYKNGEYKLSESAPEDIISLEKELAEYCAKQDEELLSIM